MPEAFIFCSVIATGISMTALTTIAIRNHTFQDPKSLSELAAANNRLLTLFRIVLVVAPTLFSVTVYGFISPNTAQGMVTASIWTVVYVSTLVAALLPARGRYLRLHALAARLMGLAMLALVYAFWLTFDGIFGLTQACIALIMTVLAVLTYTDKQKFIVYELLFIYLNHIAIVFAAIALYSK